MICILMIDKVLPKWGRLKSLMLKCPIHELPINIVINYFYARLSGQYKDYLDAFFRSLSQARRLKLSGIFLKQFKGILKIGTSTKVKNQV